ncbi:MAG: hypothetical protein ASARMPREDX12_004447 [Alectoria sarmentosa]|nr:MAG: hypothetical protein ASARMPREDX12_004447 [Alectoria sarmentosa]
MDPFSLTVGIAGILTLAAQTAKVARAFVNSAKHAKDSAKEMLQELDVLHFNLSRLENFLKTENQVGQSFDGTSVLVSSTIACRNKLTELHDKLDRVDRNRIMQLKWPLGAKEHQETIGQLRAFAQWVQFALTVDGCALLSKTSTEVLEILGQQLETFHLLGDIDRRAQSIEQSLIDQTRILRDDRAVREREQVLEWLSTFKHEQKHHDIRMPRVEGTGKWLLQKVIFQQWRDDPKSRDNTLWCHGIQGSGKSVLASLVVDHLRDNFLGQKVVVAHLYFDYRIQDYQSTENMVASLLKQLAIPLRKLPIAMLELHQRLQSQQRRPKQQELEQALLLTCREFDRVFVIIDALDECDVRGHRRSFLKALDNIRTESCTSIFITSRSYPEDIKKALENAPQISIGAEDYDLQRYIAREIDNSDNVDVIDENFRNEIITRVCHGAQKMFLLAVLQIQTILSEPTAGEMEEALKRMPQGLNDAFQETLQRIQGLSDGRRRLGLNTLMWVSHVGRPLLVAELSDALAIKLGDSTTLNQKYRPSQKMMVDCCLGLVTVDEESSVIRLVHYTVQEYFREHLNRIFPFGEQTVAQMATTYLLADPFAQGCRPEEASILALMSEYPFVKYAARHWGNHVSNAKSEQIDRLALKLLRARPQRALSDQISRYTRAFREEYWDAKEANSVNGLHVAAYFGLEGIARELLDANEVDVNSATSIGTTALIQAASNGRIDFLRMLLGKGADPSMENWYGTALHCSAESGKVASIIDLLETGLDVNIRDRRGRTPLHCATLSGHIMAMLALLERGADVNAICDQNYTSLRYAVVWEQPSEAVLTLLDKGANTEIQSNHNVTALHDAAVMGLHEVILLLLEKGAHVNARHVHGGTALHFASERNSFSIVQSLLDHGADIDIQTWDGVTALYTAAEHKCEETVRLLLDRGADTELKDEEGLTPLHVAVKENQENIVRILLEAGANEDARSNDNGSALEFAKENDYNNIAHLLQYYGAEMMDIVTSDEDDSTTALALRPMVLRRKTQDDAPPKVKQKCAECDMTFQRTCDLT